MGISEVAVALRATIRCAARDGYQADFP